MRYNRKYSMMQQLQRLKFLFKKNNRNKTHSWRQSDQCPCWMSFIRSLILILRNSYPATATSSIYLPTLPSNSLNPFDILYIHIPIHRYYYLILNKSTYNVRRQDIQTKQRRHHPRRRLRHLCQRRCKRRNLQGRHPRPAHRIPPSRLRMVLSE